jgi:hypothetical protein
MSTYPIWGVALYFSLSLLIVWTIMCVCFKEKIEKRRQAVAEVQERKKQSLAIKHPGQDLQAQHNNKASDQVKSNAATAVIKPPQPKTYEL